MTIKTLITAYSIFLFLISAFSANADDPIGLNVGDIAPNFKGSNQFEKKVELNELLKEGPVVLLFYRGHWCKYCNRQLADLSDSLKLIEDKGATVIAITPEITEFIDKTSKMFDDSFQILSDTGMTIMNIYNVKFEVNKSTVTKYKFAGINLNEFNGDNSTNLPVPATYIIGQDGIIDYVFFNKNYNKRVSVNTILLNL